MGARRDAILAASTDEERTTLRAESFIGLPDLSAERWQYNGGTYGVMSGPDRVRKDRTGPVIGVAVIVGKQNARGQLVRISRLTFVNPPVLVPDPFGTELVQVGTDGNGDPIYETYREDAAAALIEMIGRAIPQISSDVLTVYASSGDGIYSEYDYDGDTGSGTDTTGASLVTRRNDISSAELERGFAFIPFDTSALSAGDDILSAAVFVYGTSVDNSPSFNVHLYRRDALPFTGNPLTDLGGFYGSTAASGMGSGYASIGVTSTGDDTRVNKGGTSGYVLCTDDYNTYLGSGNAQSINWKSSETAGTTQDPYLVVTYDASLSTVESSFTADAVIFKPDGPGITIDAVIASSISGSLTADAVIKSTASGSLTANAVVLAVQPGSISADAVLFRAQEASFSVDAVIVSGGAFSLTVDAVLLRSQAASLTADAILQSQGAGSFTADATFLATQVGSLTADAVIKRTQSASVTQDAVIRKTQPGAFTVDAEIVSPAGPGTGSLTVDAILQRTQSHSFVADAIAKRVASGTVQADAIIRDLVESGVTADAVLLKTELASLTADAVVLATRTGGFDADSVFLSPRTGALTVDAVVRRVSTGVLTIDAVIAGPLSFTVDAVLLATAAGSFTIDAVIASTVDAVPVSSSLSVESLSSSLSVAVDDEEVSASLSVASLLASIDLAAADDEVLSATMTGETISSSLSLGGA